MNRRRSLFLVLGLCLAVIPGLLATIVLLAQRGARQAEENRDLHLANLRGAFAAWCEKDGGVLAKRLDEQFGMARQTVERISVFRDRDRILRVGKGYPRYACVYLRSRSGWPEFHRRDRYADHRADGGHRANFRLVCEELSIWSDADLAVAAESFAASCAATAEGVTGAKDDALRWHREIFVNSTDGMTNPDNRPLDEGRDGRRLALGVLGVELGVIDAARDDPQEVFLRKIVDPPFLPEDFLLDACAILAVGKTQRLGWLENKLHGGAALPSLPLINVAPGLTQPTPGQWDALVSLDRDLELGIDGAPAPPGWAPCNLADLRVDWEQAYSLFSVVRERLVAGEREGAIGDFDFVCRDSLDGDAAAGVAGGVTAGVAGDGPLSALSDIVVGSIEIYDRTWLERFLAEHPCTTQVGERTLDLTPHLEIKRGRMDRLADDLYLRVHGLVDRKEVGVIAVLKPSALDAALGAVSSGSLWLVMVPLATLSLGGILLLGVGFARERRHAARRQRFVAEAAHELKTPAALIRLHAETLALGRLDSDEDRKRYLDTIAGEAERLGQLVQKLLSFSRLEAGSLEYRFEDTDLAALASRVLEDFGPRAREAGMTLNLDCTEAPLSATVDPAALTQVLFNLLDNALKYGRGPVTLRLQRGEALELAVADRGPGIPPAQRAALLEPFARGDEGREKGGTGLGLHLVAELARGHGGSLRLTETPGGGLTAMVTLPRAGSMLA